MAQIPLDEIAREFYRLALVYPYREKLSEIFDKVHKRMSLQDSRYNICYPGMKEILRGEADWENYSSSECRELSQDIISEVWRQYQDWAFQQAVRYTLRAYELVKRILEKHP